MRFKVLAASLLAAAFALAGAQQASAGTDVTDDFVCYKGKRLGDSPAPQSGTASAASQFAAAQTLELVKPFMFCVPTIPALNTDHLLCYKAKGLKLDPTIAVVTTNAVGETHFEAKKPFLYCLSGQKTIDLNVGGH